VVSSHLCLLNSLELLPPLNTWQSRHCRKEMRNRLEFEHTEKKLWEKWWGKNEVFKPYFWCWLPHPLWAVFEQLPCDFCMWLCREEFRDPKRFQENQNIVLEMKQKCEATRITSNQEKHRNRRNSHLVFNVDIYAWHYEKIDDVKSAVPTCPMQRSFFILKY
jgi:hypothetical protein